MRGWLVEGTPLTEDEAAEIEAAGLLRGARLESGCDRLVLKWATLTRGDRTIDTGFFAVRIDRVDGTLHDPEPTLTVAFKLTS